MLKISNTNVNLKPIKIGNSDVLSFGDNVYAIGNGSNYGLVYSVPVNTVVDYVNME